MPPDLINSPQKKALTNSNAATNNKNSQTLTDKNGILPKTKASNKADRNNTSPGKKIGIKIKEEMLEVNNFAKNVSSKKQQQNLPQKESLVQETTKKITKKRKLINIKEENDSSLNHSPNINNAAANEFNPLDNILNEIDAFDTSNKPKTKKKREKLIKIESTSDVESGNAPCSSQQLPPPVTPFPSSVTNRPLNRIELARQEHDNSMVQTFLHKDDLMERILAYKMLRGKVESYLTMKAKIDLNTCITPEYEIRPDLVEPVSDRLHPKLETLIKQEQTEAIKEVEENPPLPPPFPPPPLFDSSSSFIPPPPPSLIPSEAAISQALHGPMTPPGSPGTNQSSLSATGNNHQQQKNHQQEIFPCTSDTLMTNEEMVSQKQFKLEKSESTIKNCSTNEELFKKFGAMLGLPQHQILTFFGVDSKKYGDLQFDELLATFRESLTKHLEEKEKKKLETGGKSPAASGSHLEQSQPQQQFLQEQQNILNVSNELEAAMEISSTSSSSSGVFLPPPPAPPPMLCSTNNSSFPSTSREAVVWNEGKSPILISETSISPQQQQQIKSPPTLFPQSQHQLVFTRPPPPIPTTIIRAPLLPPSQHHQLPPPITTQQQFLYPPPQVENISRSQESSTIPQQQQKRPPSLFSQVPLCFSTPPPPFIPTTTTTMVTSFTAPPPRLPQQLRQRLPPPPSQLQQHFLHPPPRPPLTSKDAESPNLTPDSIIIPRHKHKKLPSLFSQCQLVFPRPPPPILTSLTTTPPPQLPLNLQQQLHHSSNLSSRDPTENEVKSRILSSEPITPQQQRLPPPPPFPQQVPLVFTTPPPSLVPPTTATPRVASPQIPPPSALLQHQQPPQPQQQYVAPTPMPSQNDILKTVVQAINVGKTKEVKCCMSPEGDDPAATTTVDNKSKPYGKFF